MFDTYLAYERARWRIRRLDFLSIDSMNPAVTGLPGDDGMGWRFTVGIDEERTGCTDCRVTRAQGDIGIGRTMAGTQLSAALHVGGGVQAGARIDGWGFARVGASVIWRPSPRFGVRLAHEVRRPLQHSTHALGISNAEARVSLSKEYDLRLRWDSDTQRRFGLSLGRYW